MLGRFAFQVERMSAPMARGGRSGGAHCPSDKWRHKASRHERGYGWAWVQLRTRILARDLHLCQVCLANGRTASASDVDHITPKANGGADDEGNLQSLCRDCHAAKTILDNGGKPRQAIGEDGWPST